HSFSGITDLSGRWFFFVFAFTVYWFSAWEFSIFSLNAIEKKLEQRYKPGIVLFYLSSYICLYIVFITFFFDFLYRLWDTRLFHMHYIWDLVPFPHPDMIYPLMIICLLIFVADRFSRFVVLVKRAELVSERLQQENIRANYDALKNQVDPHFFFNSLSVLSSMVETNPKLASTYIYHLSKLYRYILESKKTNLVPLALELEFLDNYIFLMKIRHEGSIVFSIFLSEATINHTAVLPISLQLLVENAIKHTLFKKEDPLVIEIFEEENYICVKNSLRERKLISAPTKVGLENIQNRYRLYANEEVLVLKTEQAFAVKLPRLKI
nr:sensor histidine kinase [Prolixibacteraceae bacterium]